MSDENIEIKVQDKVSSSISTKLRNIAKEARGADSAVKLLQASLGKISASSGLQRLQTELSKTAVQQQRLATETQKTQAAMANVETALNRAVAAEARATAATNKLVESQNKAAVQAQRLATEKQKTTTAYLQSETALNRAIVAEQNAATASQRLATEQQRTAQATTQAATAATQGQTAVQNLAAATARATTAQTQGATASQRLATEQQRTAIQTANASAATDRAALATLRLQQAQQRAATSTGSLTSRLMGLRSILTIVVSALGLNAYANLTSEMTDLDARIARVTGSAERSALVFDRLSTMARRTYSDFNLTAESFLANQGALQELGYSTNQQLNFTEALNNALVISGAKAERAAQVQNALSKAMALGVLRGENLNSVIQVGGRVAELLAEQLGVGVNELRALGTQGKITGDVIYEALAGNLELTRQEADAMPATINDGLLLIRNALKLAVNDFDKMTGVSEKVANGLVWISDNLKTVGVIAVATGAALLVTFGAPLVGALGAATAALKTFTLALASNPIGLIAVAIASAIAYLVLFRDEIKLGIDDVTTLGDFFRATFEGIGQVIDDVKFIMGELWSSMTDWASEALGTVGEYISDAVPGWTETYSSFFETSNTGWAGALEVAAKTLDAIAGFLTGLATFGGRAMAEIVISVQNGISNAYNAIVGFIERTTNAAINAANRLRALVGKSAYELVQFERAGSAGQTEFESWGKLWAESLEDGFNAQGGAMQNMLNGLLSRAQEIGRIRNAAEGVDLDGNGGTRKGGGTPGAAEIKRAAALAKVNAELDNELNRLFMLAPEREAQARFDQIEEQLLGKKITLNAEEARVIRDKIEALQKAAQVQQQFDALYQEAVGPLKEYTATQEAANKLLEMGAISQEQHSRAVLRASEAYANSQDPMRQYNRDLQQQFDLLKMLPQQREIEQQVMQVQNDLLSKGIVLNEQELAQLREKLILLQQLNAVSQQEASLLSGSVDKRAQFIDQLTAINRLLADQSSGFTQSDAMTAIGGSDVGRFLVGSPEMLQAEVDQLQLMYGQIDELRQADLISEQTAAAAKLQIWNAQQAAQLKTAQTFFGHLEGLQSSNNRKLAAVGKAAAITNAVINTYQSATGAYASMASIPYVGPALGAAAAAAAIAAGMANVAQIRSQSTGFQMGGYTGNLAVDEVAGVVHGKEYVMDAATVARLGVANLDALRSGAAQVQQNSANAGTAAPSGSGAAGGDSGAAGDSVGNTTNLRIINTLDPELVGEYLASPEGEQVFVNTIRRNADSVRQAINNG